MATRASAGDEVSEERVPCGPGLGGGDGQAEDLAAPVSVHASGNQDDRVHDAAAFADLHRQRVSGDERERASLVERSVTELIDGLVQVGALPIATVAQRWHQRAAAGSRLSVS
jgi:NAD(P)H-hydrate repair Nnr-like enzyme with NAD(P)H-hydrate epimerase domain